MPILRKPRRKIPNTRKSQPQTYRLLQDLMDNIPDVIYFKDRKGHLLLVNKAHAKGLGLRPEQVVGKTDFDFFPKERARMMAKDDEHVFKTGKPFIDKIERATRADGIDNYVTTTKIPRFDEKGRVVGLIGITRDITRRMQLERMKEKNSALEKKLRILREINRLKSEFISVASHELRTPLSIVKEAVMLVFDGLAGAVNDKQREILGKAKDNIERLRKLIEELLDAGRIERGGLKLHYSLVDLNALLMDPLVFFKKLAHDKGIGLEYFLPKEQVNIFIDAERVNQIVINLINNAIAFTEEGGKVKVEVRILENKIRIGVVDTGVGIAKRDLPKIFNKFVQVTRISGAGKKGLGLGLSIAKELVECHGGEIWAESKPGVGSKFYFTLPRYSTLDMLNRELRGRINDLLSKDVPVYLVNLLIVNYKEFKERVRPSAERLFNDFNSITKTVLADVFKTGEENAEMPLIDIRRGEYSIILPGATEKGAADFCNVLKERINSYLVKSKIRGAFIVMGLLSYPRERKSLTRWGCAANLCIREIYIGAEMRRFKRINYNLDIGIVSRREIEVSRTIDISEGGICFISKRPLRTDAVIMLRLKLPKAKEALDIKGRVAWIKKVESPLEENTSTYKVGLEFTNLRSKERTVIQEFIKSAGEKQAKP